MKRGTLIFYLMLNYITCQPSNDCKPCEDIRKLEKKFAHILDDRLLKQLKEKLEHFRNVEHDFLDLKQEFDAFLSDYKNKGEDTILIEEKIVEMENKIEEMMKLRDVIVTEEKIDKLVENRIEKMIIDREEKSLFLIKEEREKMQQLIDDTRNYCEDLIEEERKNIVKKEEKEESDLIQLKSQIQLVEEELSQRIGKNEQEIEKLKENEKNVLKEMNKILNICTQLETEVENMEKTIENQMNATKENSDQISKRLVVMEKQINKIKTELNNVPTLVKKLIEEKQKLVLSPLTVFSSPAKKESCIYTNVGSFNLLAYVDGNVISSKSQTIPHGKVVKYRCINGELQGPSTRQCSNGQFDGYDPMCISKKK